MQVARISLVVGIVMLAGIGLLAGCASRAFYYPTRDVYGTPAVAGLRYEAVRFRSRDGTALSGWFIPASGTQKGTVVHFHGNAQNMTAHFQFVSWLPAAGFNVFVFDYRGYGASEGRPSREGLYEDSVAALQYVRSRPDVDRDRLLVLGQSLGGANALSAVSGAGSEGVRAVALDSTFYSYRLITRDAIRQIPVLSLLRWPLSFAVVGNRRSPCSMIGALSPIPVLVLHGTADEVVPYRHGQALFHAAGDPKQFVTVPGGQHTDALLRSDPIYRRKLVEFFENALERPAAGKARTP
jgi:uncharacterized protein